MSNQEDQAQTPAQGASEESEPTQNRQKGPNLGTTKLPIPKIKIKQKSLTNLSDQSKKSSRSQKSTKDINLRANTLQIKKSFSTSFKSISPSSASPNPSSSCIMFKGVKTQPKDSIRTEIEAYIDSIAQNSKKLSINWNGDQSIFSGRSTTLLRRHSLFIFHQPQKLYQINLKEKFTELFFLKTDWKMGLLYCFEVIYNYERTAAVKVACVIQKFESTIYEPDIKIYDLQRGILVQTIPSVLILRVPGASRPIPAQFKYDYRRECFRTNFFSGHRVHLRDHKYRARTRAGLKIIRWDHNINFWVYVTSQNQLFLEEKKGNKIVKTIKLTKEDYDDSVNIAFDPRRPIIFLQFEKFVVMRDYSKGRKSVYLASDQTNNLLFTKFQLFFGRGTLSTFRTSQVQPFFHSNKKTFPWLAHLKFGLKKKTAAQLEPDWVDIFRRGKAYEQTKDSDLAPNLRKLKQLNKFLVLNPQESLLSYPLLMSHQKIVEFDHLHTRIRKEVFVNKNTLKVSKIILLNNKLHLSVVYDMGLDLHQEATSEDKIALFSTWSVKTSEVEAVGPREIKYLRSLGSVVKLIHCDGIDSLFTIQKGKINDFPRAGRSLYKVDWPKKGQNLSQKSVREKLLFGKLGRKRRKEMSFEGFGGGDKASDGPKSSLPKLKEHLILNEWNLRTGDVKAVFFMPVSMNFYPEDPELSFDPYNRTLYVKIAHTVYIVNRDNYEVEEVEPPSAGSGCLLFPHKIHLKVDLKAKEVLYLAPKNPSIWQLSFYKLGSKMQEVVRFLELAACSGFMILEQKRLILTERRAYSLDEGTDAEEEAEHARRYNQVSNRKADPNNIYFKLNRKGFRLSKNQNFIYGGVVENTSEGSSQPVCGPESSQIGQNGVRRVTRLEKIDLFKPHPDGSELARTEAGEMQIDIKTLKNAQNSKFYVIESSSDFYCYGNGSQQLIIKNMSGFETELDPSRGLYNMTTRVKCGEIPMLEYARRLILLSRLCPELVDCYSLFSLLMLDGAVQVIKEHEVFFDEAVKAVLGTGFKILRHDMLIPQSYKRRFYRVFKGAGNGVGSGKGSQQGTPI